MLILVQNRSIAKDYYDTYDGVTGDMEVHQKINKIVYIPGEEKCNRYLPSINSQAAVANNISPAGAMNPCHTVTHVTHVTQISLDHCSNKGLDASATRMAQNNIQGNRWKTGYCK